MIAFPPSANVRQQFGPKRLQFLEDPLDDVSLAGEQRLGTAGVHAIERRIVERGWLHDTPRRELVDHHLDETDFYTRFTRLDNGLVESSNLYVTLVDWHLNSGDSLHSLFDANVTYERLFEPFEISPGVVLPAGEYRFTRWRIFFTSAQKRRIQGSIGFNVGNFWSGTAKMIQTGLSYKFPPYFSISLNTNQAFASLPQGSFIARFLSRMYARRVSPLRV